MGPPVVHAGLIVLKNSIEFFHNESSFSRYSDSKFYTHLVIQLEHESNRTHMDGNGENWKRLHGRTRSDLASSEITVAGNGRHSCLIDSGDAYGSSLLYIIAAYARSTSAQRGLGRGEGRLWPPDGVAGWLLRVCVFLRCVEYLPRTCCSGWQH